MVRIGKLGAGATMAVLLASTGVHADITPQEVWDGLGKYYADIGQSVTAAATGMDGDTLIVTDAVIAGDEGERSFSAKIHEIRLRDLGDGRVEMTLSPEVPVEMVTKMPDGTGEQIDMVITQTDLKVIVSGSPEDTLYDYAAPRVDAIINDMKAAPENPPATIEMTLEKTAGSYRVISTGSRRIVSDLRSERGHFNVSAVDNAKSENFTLAVSLDQITGTSEAIIPSGVDMADLNEALQAGMAMNGTFAYLRSSVTADTRGTEGAGGDFHVEGAAADGTLTFRMTRDGLSYSGAAGSSTLSLETAALPTPVDVALERNGFDITFPVAPSDEAQPFGLGLDLVGLTLSEGLWSLFDPAKALPRDPAALTIDLAGTARMFVSLFDPSEIAALGTDLPAEVDSLDLEALRLSAAGAELSGSGALTFDNSQPTPRPKGVVDLALVGGGALIDRLVGMGLVTQEQSMGARMMLGLFAVPNGEDSLTSKIEFKDEGIFANGQRIQ